MQKSAELNGINKSYNVADRPVVRRGLTMGRRWTHGLLLAGLLSLTACATTSIERLDTAKQSFANAQYAQTISNADAFLAANPSGAGRADALYLKGRALEEMDVSSESESNQHLAQARYCYQLALREPATIGLQGRIYAGIANTSFHLGDYDIAMSNWQQAYANIDLPDDKPWILYRIGLCQQRLGQFAQADQTFVLVQRQYPSAPAATRSREHAGYRAFYVQLAVFSSSSLADKATATLQKQGIVVARFRDTQSRDVLRVGPYPSYPGAVAALGQLTRLYPDAMVVP